MKNRSSFFNLAVGLGVSLGAWGVSAAEITLTPQQRASGVQWGAGYSVPNNEGHLEVGADPNDFGAGNGNTSTQLRFDVSSLNGAFTSINSVTLRLTQFFSHANRADAVVEAHRLLPANTDWNNNGSYGTQNGANAWAGGASGALVAGTDHDPTILGSVTIHPPNAIGAVYDLVISGQAANDLITAWLATGNEGLLLRANQPAPNQDSRIGVYADGPNAPKLIINYTPVPTGPTLTQEPADANAPEGGAAAWSVQASGAPPLSFQWQRDGTNIPSATSTNYTLAQARMDDTGAQFRCVVTDGGSLSATSRVATLTVIPDRTPPTLLGVTGVNFTTVEVTFSEPVSPASATFSGNYTLDGPTVLAVAMGADPARVLLTTTPQVVGNTYTLTVDGVSDASSGLNFIAPSVATFTTPASRLTLAAQHRASGAEWAPSFSEPNQEQMLVAGAVPQAFGVGHGRQSVQLRFDVTELNGGYSAIQSMTIRLTQQYQWSREQSSLEAYRLLPANAGWDNNGTFGTQNGSTPWAGGASGALVPDVDYDSFLLGNVGYNPAASVGTVYDLVIPGDIAGDIINAWASGAGNEGFLLRGVVPEGYTGDNRVGFYHEGPNGPKLIVEFSPLTLSITQQPVDTTAVEGGSATFTVILSGAPPYNYQWLRDGVHIPNATNSSYTISSVQMSDTGAQFAVSVGDASGSHLSSSSATLTVTPDGTPPTLLGATGVNFTTVEVRFSEPVNAGTATHGGNYAISDGLTVLSAVMGTDPAKVILTTTPQAAGRTYTLVVNGVRDASSGANLIQPDATTTFTQPSTFSFAAQQRASGAEWAPGFSEPNQEQMLIAGAVPQAFGVGHGRQSVQLRFDLSALKGGSSALQSMTIRLTQKYQWSRDASTLEAYRLLPANAGWNNNGTFGTQDGANPWAGGANGALVPNVDYDSFLLGSVGYNPAAPVDTVYDLVIPGNIASDIINAWSSGAGNEGFLLRAAVPDGYAGDNRAGFYHEGSKGPQLVVEYAACQAIIRYTRLGGRLTLAWDCPGYVLESTAQLPAVTWTEVPGQANGSATVDTATGHQFFRLRSP